MTTDYCDTFWEIYDKLSEARDDGNTDEVKRLTIELDEHRKTCTDCPPKREAE